MIAPVQDLHSGKLNSRSCCAFNVANELPKTSPKYRVKASAPAGVSERAASGMPDAVVAEPEDAELVDVAGVAELDKAAVVDDDSAGGDDDVVQADVTVGSPRTTATPTHLNARPT